MVLLHHLPLHETSCANGRICPWGECSLIHNLACTIPNLLFFLMHLVLWFVSSPFSIAAWQENLRQLSQNGFYCMPAAMRMALPSCGQEKCWQSWSFSPIKVRKCKQSNEILTSGSVLLTNTTSDSWPVLEFLNGIIIHSCWPRWNLGYKY